MINYLVVIYYTKCSTYHKKHGTLELNFCHFVIWSYCNKFYLHRLLRCIASFEGGTNAQTVIPLATAHILPSAFWCQLDEQRVKYSWARLADSLWATWGKRHEQNRDVFDYCCKWVSLLLFLLKKHRMTNNVSNTTISPCSV